LSELSPEIRLQRDCTAASHALHLFLALLPIERMSFSREELIVALRARNIGATIHYTPLHGMPLYLGDRPTDQLPVTEDVAARCITLPISASMTAADAEEVIESFRAVYA
jgi:dTDP-4-amino-4,6-dideoxygalactose transaminase